MHIYDPINRRATCTYICIYIRYRTRVTFKKLQSLFPNCSVEKIRQRLLSFSFIAALSSASLLKSPPTMFVDARRRNARVYSLLSIPRRRYRKRVMASIILRSSLSLSPSRYSCHINSHTSTERLDNHEILKNHAEILQLNQKNILANYWDKFRRPAGMLKVDGSISFLLVEISSSFNFVNWNKWWIRLCWSNNSGTLRRGP